MNPINNGKMPSIYHGCGENIHSQSNCFHGKHFDLFIEILNFFSSIFSHFSYVFSAPDQLLESMPGTLMLTDCLEACQANESCGAVNYETGLCVLFSSNADKLPGKTINFQ